MKKRSLILLIFIFSISTSAFSQYSSSKIFSSKLSLNEKKSIVRPNVIPTPGASMGFNIGFASIEGEIGFAIGAFAELRAKDISFVPQANYWNAKKQTNFEIAGLARFYLAQKGLFPYLDGGLGMNFYNSDKINVTKLSVIAGGGIELTDLGTSFNLLFDAKYKLIVNDAGNLSCFIFTAGMKFPLK